MPFALNKIATEKKGWGVSTAEIIPQHAFVIEYLGERLNIPTAYDREKHYENVHQGNYMFYVQR